MADVSSRAGRGKSDGAKHIHDQVDVDELDGVQGRVSCGSITEDHSHEDGEVAGNLELEETLNVKEDVASPHDRLHARVKAVALEDHRAVISSIRYTIGKGEGHIGSLEGLDVIDAFTNNGNGPAWDSFGTFLGILWIINHSAETSNQSKLVFWVSASNDSKIANDTLKLLLTFWREAIAVVDLFIVRTHLIFSLNNITDSGTELCAVHC